MERYGKYWPQHANDVSIELKCFLNPPPQGHDRATHLLSAIRAGFPERDANGRAIYAIHDWALHRHSVFCRHLRGGDRYGKYISLWGPAASSKTTDMAMAALMYWAASPADTVVILCSTTKPLLERRIWGEITKYYSMFEGMFPGELTPSKFSITLDPKNPRAGIFGVPVLRGTIKEALGNIYGQHNRRVLLIVDEAQATRIAAIEAADNLSAGCEEFLMIIMGNPESMFDPLGIYSEPVDGYDKISPDTHSEWETKMGGYCYFYDGLKSPGIAHPDRYPFLLSREQIEQVRKKRGENSPQFWSQRRGFLPMVAGTETAFSEAFLLHNRMLETGDDVLWNDYQIFAGCDPTGSVMGDPAMAVCAKVGTTLRGERLIVFQEPQQIVLDARDDKTPVSYQISREYTKFRKHNAVPRRHAAIECSANQGAIADVCDMERAFEGEDPAERHLRIQFGGAPSDRPVSVDDFTEAKDLYEDRLTELWYALMAFGRYKQIRGLTKEVARQLCMRMALIRGGRTKIESKRDMRRRGVASPNDADAVITCLEAIRQITGFVAGSGSMVKRELDERRNEGVPVEIVMSQHLEAYSRHRLDEEDDGSYSESPI